MAISEHGGYECPACGFSATSVKYTVSYRTHISRKRECMTCGHVHETIEMRVDMAALLNFARQITEAYEQAGGKNALALVEATGASV